MTPAQRVAAVLAACALAVPLLARFEGYRPVGYADVGGVATDCYGETRGAVIGRRRTADQCTAALAQSAVAHGLDVSRCLPDDLAPETRAAFTSAAYNLGSAKFCASSMSRRALAGDLAGACAALSLYVFVGSKDCRIAGSNCAGIVTRRIAEREMCERGLPTTPSAYMPAQNHSHRGPAGEVVA